MVSILEKNVCKCGGNVLNNNDKSFIQLQGNKVAVIKQCLIMRLFLKMMLYVIVCEM